jgi:hypothetical protein
MEIPKAFFHSLVFISVREDAAPVRFPFYGRTART